jgi:hypothetical protein
MYLERAEEEDQKMAESWKGDAEGILVFVSTHLLLCFTSRLRITDRSLLRRGRDTPSGLHSRTSSRALRTLQRSTSRMFISYSPMKMDPIIIPSVTSLTNPAASFTVPASAVWVNSLWLLSLVISLPAPYWRHCCNSGRGVIFRLTHPRCSPHKRARIRAFFAEGVERLHLPWTVEALPTLLHISLFLFFAGLGVYLFGVHKTVFSVVIAWVGLCVVVYAYVTALPILHKDSPYHAPLSTFIWFCIAFVRYTFFSAPDPPPRSNTNHAWDVRQS